MNDPRNPLQLNIWGDIAFGLVFLFGAIAMNSTAEIPKMELVLVEITYAIMAMLFLNRADNKRSTL